VLDHALRIGHLMKAELEEHDVALRTDGEKVAAEEFGPRPKTGLRETLGEAIERSSIRSTATTRRAGRANSTSWPPPAPTSTTTLLPKS